MEHEIYILLTDELKDTDPVARLKPFLARLNEGWRILNATATPTCVIYILREPVKATIPPEAKQ